MTGNPEPEVDPMALLDTLDACIESFWCITKEGTDDRLLADGAIDAAKRLRAHLPASSAGARVRPMGTAPSGPDALEPETVEVHEGAWAIVIGTNGKAAGWIDTHALFAHQLYRDHILPSGEADALRGELERDEAYVYAKTFLVSFVKEHCDPVEGWAPLPDLLGVLTQLDNATTITRDIKARAETAEAALAAANATIEEAVKVMEPFAEFAPYVEMFIAGRAAMSDELSDAQWCVLDLLVQARRSGIRQLSRTGLLSTTAFDDAVKMKLVFAALTMPSELVEWQGRHHFEITDHGLDVYRQRFERSAPAAVIALPDLSSPAP